MRHKAGKENETQTKHTGRNIVGGGIGGILRLCRGAGAFGYGD